MLSFEPDTPLAGDVSPSPNHDARRSGPARALVLHYTGMTSADGALRWLCVPESKVSCHYFVFENGRVVQLVPEDRRAWHAGAGSWHGEADMNSASIGIEIANPGHAGDYPDFPEMQIGAVIALCRDILARNTIAAPMVIAHSDMAPRRKADPGEKFPWEALHAAGIGLWTKPARIGGGRFLQQGERGQPVEALQAMLAMLGYGLPLTGAYDEDTAFTVTAFQRHWRPERVDGVADASTITTLRDLLRFMPRET